GGQGLNDLLEVLRLPHVNLNPRHLAQSLEPLLLGIGKFVGAYFELAEQKAPAFGQNQIRKAIVAIHAGDPIAAPGHRRSEVRNPETRELGEVEHALEKVILGHCARHQPVVLAASVINPSTINSKM